MVLTDVFDEIAWDWGWHALTHPEPVRSAHLDERFQWFTENVERPRYEAAISWQEGCQGLECPSEIDDLADEGRTKGYGPSFSYEEARSRFPALESTYVSTFRLGKKFPYVEEEHHKKICDVMNAIDPILQEVEKGLTSMDSQDNAVPKIALTESKTEGEAPTTLVNRYDDLIEHLRKKGARIQAALLEFMKARRSAEIENIAHEVHGDERTSEGAIRSNVKRTNDAFVVYGLPIKFRVASGFVFKEEQAE